MIEQTLRVAPQVWSSLIIVVIKSFKLIALWLFAASAFLLLLLLAVKYS